MDNKLGELSGDVEQLPQQAKTALASLLDDSLPELQDLVNKVEGRDRVLRFELETDRLSTVPSVAPTAPRASASMPESSL